MRTIHVESMTRLSSITTGDPMWRITATEGVWQTAPGAGIAHTMTPADEDTDKVIVLDDYDRIINWFNHTRR